MSDIYEKESRRGWYAEGRQPTTDELTLGCLQRIATATESMARNHDQLVRERDNARSERDYWRNEAEKARRRLSAAKGRITRLKRAAQQPGEGNDG